MAEVSPEEDLLEQEEDVFVEDPENPISVLLLATKWQFDTYGLSTVNKSLVNNLRIADPNGQKIKITCAVVEEEKFVKEHERSDAEKYKVKLKGSKQPRGPRKKPNIEWLDQSTAAYYLDLFMTDTFDFIIGHVPYLANGPFNFKDMYSHRDKKPKIVLFVHGLPKTTAGDVDDDSLLEWLGDSDIVFSVGKAVQAEIFSYIASLPLEHQPTHKLYIPTFPLDLFKVRRAYVEGNKVQGTQNITMMTGDRKDLEISGLDFPLAVASVSKASKHILDFDSVKTNFELLTNNKEDKDEWKKEFSELIQKEEYKGRSLHFQADTPESLDKLKTHLRKSNLFILPLKPTSSIFGTEALSAVAAGVPILVSQDSGIASLLEAMVQTGSILQESSLEAHEKTWRDGIIQKIVKPHESKRAANTLREQLLLDTSIAQTHLDFIKTVTEASCVHLKVDLDSDSVVAQEHIDAAIKFDIDLSSADALNDTKKYVLAFIRKVLLQREKLDHGLLTDYMESDIVSLWQEVLSTLENSNRKLLDVQIGSLIFTLFCPTMSSSQELTNDSWIQTLLLKMESFVRKIGIKSHLRIDRSEDDPRLLKTELLLRLQQKKSRHVSGESEGYETMTQDSSDVASEIFYGRRKVMQWLRQQEDPIAQADTSNESSLTLQEMIKVNHIVHLTNSSDLEFSVSEFSGSVGIASAQAKPSLSVMYPGTDKPPVILSKDKGYMSAIFMMISDQEYLATASKDKIRLWNLTKNTSHVVYKFRERSNWRLCLIDEKTVACVDVGPSSMFSKIHVLNTDAEMWRLSSTHTVEVKNGISDMCFVRTTDSTSCLILSCPGIDAVQLVELIGGTVRWQVDKHQASGSFFPWSLCTDGSTVFVVDAFSAKLHLLAVEDGSAIKSVNLHPLGITLPSCVRLQAEYLFVGHLNEHFDAYCIGKCVKPLTM